MAGMRPTILVVDNADTSRAPVLKGLLQRVLGREVDVESAGVVAHIGDPPEANALLAIEPLGVSLDDHAGRQYDSALADAADLIVAVDRGTARVATMQTETEVVVIGELAEAGEVIDPYRMPLPAWIAVVRAYEAQVSAVLPEIRSRLNLTERRGDFAVQPEPPHPGRGEPETFAQPAPHIIPASQPAEASPRREHLDRIRRLIETARALPEIIDWSKLAQEAGERLRAVAALAEGPADLTPAATAMIAGLLFQANSPPGAEQLHLLQSAVDRLDSPVDPAGLAQIGRIIGRYQA